MAIVLFLFLLKNLAAIHIISLPEGIDIAYWSDKKYLRPLRLVNIVALFISIRYVMVLQKNWFQTERIAYLGRYSLEVFTFHILLIILFVPLNGPLNRIMAIPVMGKYYFYPFETLLALFIVIALYAAPPIWDKVSVYYKHVKNWLFARS